MPDCLIQEDSDTTELENYTEDQLFDEYANFILSSIYCYLRYEHVKSIYNKFQEAYLAWLRSEINISNQKMKVQLENDFEQLRMNILKNISPDIKSDDFALFIANALNSPDFNPKNKNKKILKVELREFAYSKILEIEEVNSAVFGRTIDRKKFNWFIEKFIEVNRNSLIEIGIIMPKSDKHSAIDNFKKSFYRYKKKTIKFGHYL